MLTQENTNDLERVQKSLLGVILGPNYQSYEEACHTLQVKTLAERRKELLVNFFLKVRVCKKKS